MQTPDFTTARRFMVDGQVRPNKVNDPRLLEALRTLPRERFLPESAAPLAYADEDVPLGNRRVLVAPMLLARLVQAILDTADPASGGGKALVVGAGSGYGAAVLSACGFAVTACEDDPALYARARIALAATAPRVTVLEAGPADLPRGPFDVILIEGGFEIMPDTIPARLTPRAGSAGGRLYGVRLDAAGLGQAVEGEMTSAGLALRPLFDAFTSCLPALAAAPGFVF